MADAPERFRVGGEWMVRLSDYAALEQDAENARASCDHAGGELQRTRETLAALEQERELLRGTLFRAEAVIKAYAPDSIVPALFQPVLDAIDRALTKGENDGRD